MMTMFNPSSTLKAVIFFSDIKLYSKQHIQWILNKTHKITRSIRKLQPIILRRALLTIFTSFLTPPLDYWDIMYDHTFNEAFQDKLLESVQYNAPLAIKGAIRSSSREKLCQELGLEILKSCW